MNKQTQFRVLLDTNAQDALTEMLQELKDSGDFVKINPSRLVSWIVEGFKKESFEKKKDQIIQDHFNSKEYLRNIAKTISDSDDLEKVLRDTIMQLKPKRSKNVSKENRQEKDQ